MDSQNIIFLHGFVNTSVSVYFFVMGQGEIFLTRLGSGYSFCCSDRVGSASSGSGKFLPKILNVLIFLTYVSKKSHQMGSKNARHSPLFTKKWCTRLQANTLQRSQIKKCCYFDVVSKLETNCLKFNGLLVVHFKGKYLYKSNSKCVRMSEPYSLANCGDYISEIWWKSSAKPRG